MNKKESNRRIEYDLTFSTNNKMQKGGTMKNDYTEWNDM